MGKNWAICIGINNYYYMPRLRYAVQDATAIRDFFLQDGRFEQVYYFAEDAPPIETSIGRSRDAQPSYTNLKRFLRQRFQRKFLEVGDNFWFFFAGYGERHRGHDYLMPLDVDPDNLEETALRISDITAYLRNCGADNTLMLLDASSPQQRRGQGGIGTEEQQGMIMVYACSPGELSFEIDELGHGAFTHTLLEGFKLQGASNCATVGRLDQYLRYQVPLLNKQYGRPMQTPYTVVEPLSKNYMILLPQQATLQDLQALKTEAQKAELANELDLSQQFWVRVLADSPGDQDAITAINRIALKKTGHTNTSAPELVKPPELRVNWEPKKKQCFTELAIQLDLMLIPSGIFTMGSPEDELGRWKDEGPQHEVTVSTFLMGRYPVTQAQWRIIAKRSDLKVGRNLKPDPSAFQGDDYPVKNVSWHDAVEFCARLSKLTGHTYRLPTEAEWEYACRASTTSPFHFGESITTDLANYVGEDREGNPEEFPGNYGTGPKGIYRKEMTTVNHFHPLANTFGLCEMHGNVWEWCQDHWHENYEGAPVDSNAWLSNDEIASRVIRGGSWNHAPRQCRSACRARENPSNRVPDLGFRVTCKLTEV
ncbi:MAG: SUMF1/EgtB/PvdO family nonheme iron enzyme [Cyanobacteria bacterium P01_B01_bin.77]